MNLQEETLLFYYELGTAITQWAQLELSLLLLLRSCFPSKQGAAVARGYLSIDAFNRKLAFRQRGFDGAPKISEGQETMERGPGQD